MAVMTSAHTMNIDNHHLVFLDVTFPNFAVDLLSGQSLLIYYCFAGAAKFCDVSSSKNKITASQVNINCSQVEVNSVLSSDQTATSSLVGKYEILPLFTKN